jgi:hypothetical protein
MSAVEFGGPRPCFTVSHAVALWSKTSSVRSSAFELPGLIH